MTKNVETGAVPAKSAATSVIESQNGNAENSDVRLAPVAAPVHPRKDYSGGNDGRNKKHRFANKKKAGIPDVAANYPEHVVAIALLIKNNAEIRRFTALGILNYLLQKNEIKGENRYVAFKWNKFAVKCGGLTREFSYSEPFFINALIASFSSFSASAQRAIDNFCHKEMYVGLDKAADQDEVDNIVALNDSYQRNHKDEEEELIDPVAVG